MDAPALLMAAATMADEAFIVALRQPDSVVDTELGEQLAADSTVAQWLEAEAASMVVAASTVAADGDKSDLMRRNADGWQLMPAVSFFVSFHIAVGL